MSRARAESCQWTCDSQRGKLREYLAPTSRKRFPTRSAVLCVPGRDQRQASVDAAEPAAAAANVGLESYVAFRVMYSLDRTAQSAQCRVESMTAAAEF